ncbi:MAG: VCBS repeat-containing protein, partial [Chloroflexi bacterium]|nr:VCBS repeat-containing protein [Chloroflexota bacterium]
MAGRPARIRGGRREHRLVTRIVHGGREAFATGRFDDGGSNLYVNARGEIERIHRTDLDGDGRPDIVIPNTHGSLDRGPTRVFTLADGAAPGPAATWTWRDLPNPSGWLCRAIDLDGDGHLDLIVVNGENGVTSELTSFVYWGGPGGLTGERTEFETTGAYDVVVADLDGDGRLDLLLTSAWTDHHNEGRPRPLQAFLQRDGRRFEDGTAQVGLTGVAAVALGLGDVLGRGTQDLVVANLRTEYIVETDSYVYPGRRGEAGGFERDPIRLPTRAASQVRLADLDEDGRPEILFAGGDQVRIYWNGPDGVSADCHTVLEIPGLQTQFWAGALAIEIADVDGDGRAELLVAAAGEIQVRRADALDVVAATLPIPYAAWLHAVDLDADGRPELVVSVHEDDTTYDVDSLLLWNGPAGLSMDRVTRLPLGGGMGATSADLDGDGRPELILNSTVAGPTSRWKEFPVFVYPGSANDPRRFDIDRRIDLHSGGETYAYAIADLDLDGHADLVLARIYGVRIFPGGPDGIAPDRWYELPITTGYCMQVHIAD